LFSDYSGLLHPMEERESLVAAPPCCILAEEVLRQRPARDSRNAAISSPLRTSKTSPTSTGWFQVLPLIAGNRASSLNWSGVAATSASSPSSDSTSSKSSSDNSTSWPLPYRPPFHLRWPSLRSMHDRMLPSKPKAWPLL